MARLAYEIEGTINLLTALHIGSGNGDPTTDATIVRDARGTPYIPGSSLRGVLRSAVEACAPDELTCRGMATAPGACLWLEQRQLDKELDRLVERGTDTEAEIIALLRINLCPTCRLFGTVYWASPLLIPDLFPATASVIRPQVRHGVGIDRDTGAAREQIKYDFEVLNGGVSFDLWLRCTLDGEADASEDQCWLGLLALGLRVLQMGTTPLGGRAARGVGRVRLDLRRIAQFPMHGNDLLRSLIGAAPDDQGFVRLAPGAQWLAGAATSPDSWLDAQLAAILPEGA